MDWTGVGDVHKRFYLSKRKCELIFSKPFDKVEETEEVHLLLLW